MPRVLLVDDDIAEISAVKRVLARAGHQAVLATNAADALAAVGRMPPAALVVASTCEAGEALRRLAEDGAAGALPLVVLGETPAAPAGAAQVARPVDPAVLADRLAAALGVGAAPAPAAPVAAAPPRAPSPPPAAARRRAAPAAPAVSTATRPPNDRRAAADALRARAEELRRGPAPIAPIAPAATAQEPLAEAGSATDAALAELATPIPGGLPALDLEHDPGLEAILRRAEEAEARARQGARRAKEEAAARATQAQAQAQAHAEAEAARAAEERARAEEEAHRAAQAEAEIEAARAAEERARAEEEESRRAAQAEAEIEAARAAEERARAEREARERADQARLQRELKGARRAPAPAPARESEDEKLRAAIRSARDEMEALRRRSGAEEEHLRAAIESARAEMEALRKRGEEEARRRVEAEAEVSRLAREAEVARLAREAERTAAEAAARPPPLDVPVYRPPADDPAPDPAQETARRRVAALRERAPAPADAAPASVEEPPRAPFRPPAPELRAGTVAELPMPRLLALASRTELSGRIDVEGEASRSLYLEAGRVVGATSSAPSERIEEVALRLGLVTRDQHRLVAASAAPLATRRAAVLLLERGFLKPNELGPLVRRRTEEVVFGAFGEPGARFRWAAADVPPDESTALERTALQLAVEGVRRRWLAPEVNAVLGGDATLVSPVATGPGAADLGLSAEERRILTLADGLRTLDEIVAASPLDPLSTRQALAALVLVGTLAVRTFQGGRPAAAASAAIDLARVRDKLDQVRRADYFAVLGVGRLCTPHEVREALERLRAEFDPRRFQGVREEGLEGRLEEIQRVIADARDVLADDRLRAEYLRGLGE